MFISRISNNVLFVFSYDDFTVVDVVVDDDVVVLLVDDGGGDEGCVGGRDAGKLAYR